MLRAFLTAAALLRSVTAPGSVTGPGPCDPEIKPLTTPWEHTFALGSGAFFRRGTTPLLSSSLRWMPSYALDPGGNRRLGAIVGLALENPELDPQLGARFSMYHPMLDFAAGYEISPEVAVGLRTGHVRLGAELDLALIKTLRIGLRPQVDLPDWWPVLELVTSFSIAREPRRDSVAGGESPGTNEDLSRWDNFFASRVRIRSSALFASPALDTLDEAAKDAVRQEWKRQCRDRERALQAFLRTGSSAPTLDSLIERMDRTVPEFAATVRAARRDARRDVPAEAPPDAVVKAAVRGLRRALEPEGP